MNDKVLKYYLDFSTFTYPGLYQDKLKNDLPDDIREIGLWFAKTLFIAPLSLPGILAQISI